MRGQGEGKEGGRWEGQGKGQEEAAASDGGTRRGSENDQRSVSERFWAFLPTWTVGSMASVVAFSTRALGGKGGEQPSARHVFDTCSARAERPRLAEQRRRSAMCSTEEERWAARGRGALGSALSAKGPRALGGECGGSGHGGS